MLCCMLDALCKCNQWNIKKASKFQLQRDKVPNICSNILLLFCVSKLISTQSFFSNFLNITGMSGLCALRSWNGHQHSVWMVQQFHLRLLFNLLKMQYLLTKLVLQQQPYIRTARYDLSLHMMAKPLHSFTLPPTWQNHCCPSNYT